MSGCKQQFSPHGHFTLSSKFSSERPKVMLRPVVTGTEQLDTVRRNAAYRFSKNMFHNNKLTINQMQEGRLR